MFPCFPCFWQYNGVAERYKCFCSYKNRLKELKLFSLEQRRERYLIIMLFKIAIEYVVNPGLVVEVDQRGRWRYHRKFTTDNNIPTWIRSARNNGFHSNGPLLFNNLPSHLRVRKDPATDPRQGRKLINSFKTKFQNKIG
jgi:hypothetical protein